MYVPPHFEVSDTAVSHDLIAHHPLGVLITQSESGLNANHIPFEVYKKHEESQPKPWKMSDALRDYMEMMVKSIVCIEIEITRLVGKFKLSQNRENRDRLNAGQMLVEQGNDLLGKAMLDVLPPK